MSCREDFTLPIIVTETPSDFVDYLTDPGLPVYDMSIPLKQYVCADPSFGGNAEASRVIGYANQKIYLNENTKTSISSQTRNIGRLTTGQGYPDELILLMEHMADNIGKMRSASELKEVFSRSQSRRRGDPQQDGRKKVFGMDCIGFVSQYLVYAGVWQEYKPYYPADYPPANSNP